MKIREMKDDRLSEIAEGAGTTLAMMKQLKYGCKAASRFLSRRIEKASGGEINRLELMYPDEFRDKPEAFKRFVEDTFASLLNEYKRPASQ